MSILNQYGSPTSSSRKMIHASDKRAQGLQYTPELIKDFDELFSATDWRSTVTQSRIVFSNFPVPRSASMQKAWHSVGNAWKPEFIGEDAEWGENELLPFLDLWSKNLDVRGEMFDLNMNLHLDSVAIDRDGDVFALLTEDNDGFPKIQKIGAHRVGDRVGSGGKAESGPFQGRAIRNGVIKNNFGRTLAYQILGDTADEDRIVDANDCIMLNDPDWHDQGRGVPAFAAVIPELRKAKTSEEWELMAQLVNSAHSLVEYNETGTADFTSDVANQGVADDGLNVQSLSGGMIRYFKANSGAKLEAINSARPSDSWDVFQDRVQRLACTCVSWGYELTWKPEGLNSVSVRSVQDKARHAVARRQVVLRRGLMRQAEWAVTIGIKNGYLAAPTNAQDWDKFTFSLPPQMTIDPRHDSKTEMEDFKIGRKNMTQLLKRDGKTLVPHIKERLWEIVQRKLLKQEYELKYGVEIDDREIMMLTPNEMAEPDEIETPVKSNDNEE